MAHKNTKIERKKQYNPFVARTIKRAEVGKVKIYLREVKPNPVNKYGFDLRKYPIPFDESKIYYYEVGANDGSYRKCSTKEDALKMFGMLIEFEKRQTEIR